MTLTLLLDLDDTLLGTHLEVFVPAYFQALTGHLSARVEPEKMLQALLSGMRLMTQSSDPSCTLQEVFEADFYRKLGVSKEELSGELERFYDEIFPALQRITSPVTEAVPFVEWARSRGYRIAIATDPFFPRKATLHRVRWAGFDPQGFELISSFESFHFSKSHPAYYAEMLGRLGWPEGPVLMIGNDLERDIFPAQRLGLATWYVDTEPRSSSGTETGARGKLADLRLWLESTDVSKLVPAFETVESLMALLTASPASLQGLCADVDRAMWHRDPASEDWALTEIACHLRDTEREIHHMQIKLLKDEPDPFIPRPDTSVWASQRDYFHENGYLALNEFTQARIETIAALKQLTEQDWTRKARHAIFGPTDFLEVVRFMADHDRMHIQQAWKAIRAR